MTLEEILPKLKGVRKSGNSYLAFCPAHNDRAHRSLSLTEKEGKLLMHCFVGCSYGQILDALGVKKEFVIPEIEAVYDYVNEEGELLYQSIRYYPKAFKQRRPDGKGDYIWDLKGISAVLYQLPAVLGAKQTIYFVEGEKDCLNLNHYGLIATTRSGGASSKWQPQYSEALKGATVAIIPDGDEPGKRYAETTANMLYGWASSLKLLNLGSQDVTEWLKNHNTDELESLSKNTKEYIPLGAVTREEFNQLKGHLIYIQGKLKTSASKRKTNEYNPF